MKQKITEGMETAKVHLLGWEVLDYQYEDLPWSEFYWKMDTVRKGMDIIDFLNGKKVLKLDVQTVKAIIRDINDILYDWEDPSNDEKTKKELEELKFEKKKLLKAINLKKYDKRIR